MAGEGNWLDDMDDPSIGQNKQREQNLEFARLHKVFEEDPRGRELLEFWQKTVMRKRVPANATLQEYAAHEAVRCFIQTIEDQLRFATTEGRQP